MGRKENTFLTLKCTLGNTNKEHELSINVYKSEIFPMEILAISPKAFIIS